MANLIVGRISVEVRYGERGANKTSHQEDHNDHQSPENTMVTGLGDLEYPGKKRKEKATPGNQQMTRKTTKPETMFPPEFTPLSYFIQAEYCVPSFGRLPTRHEVYPSTCTARLVTLGLWSPNASG